MLIKIMLTSLITFCIGVLMIKLGDKEMSGKVYAGVSLFLTVFSPCVLVICVLIRIWI